VAGKKKLRGGNLKAINNTSSTNNIMLSTEAEKPRKYWTISDHVAFYLETHFIRGLNISPLPEDKLDEWGW
jgi:hypothetical protein